MAAIGRLPLCSFTSLPLPTSARPVLRGLPVGSALRLVLRTSLLLVTAAGGLLTAAGAAPPLQGSPSSQPAGSLTPTPAPDPALGLITIEADRQLADQRTGVVTAIGRVRISYPPRQLVATARQAQYYSREGRLVLSGDVDLQEAGGQSLRAERLVYRLDSERLEVMPAPGRQVITRLRLQPPAGTRPAPVLQP